MERNLRLGLPFAFGVVDLVVDDFGVIDFGVVAFGLRPRGFGDYEPVGVAKIRSAITDFALWLRAIKVGLNVGVDYISRVYLFSSASYSF